MKSVLECIDEATRCGRRALEAADERQVLRELELAALWLELAKSHARSGDRTAWAGKPPTSSH
ncbi:MAG: hypothetical protein JSS04_09410 [Proteobacteria bacterium]|nr:hypothetical protein [Pseudomonadota bacterium]